MTITKHALLSHLADRRIHRVGALLQMAFTSIKHLLPPLMKSTTAAPYPTRGHRRLAFDLKDLRLDGVIEQVRYGYVRLSPLQPLPAAFADPSVPRGGRGESPWHRATVGRIEANPLLVLDDVTTDRVIRTWCDACRSTNGDSLWLALWCGKHPDVVFEQASGKLTVVEVEPDDTAAEGFAQLWGDYCTALRVDRRRAGVSAPIRGVLVTEAAADILRRTLGDMVEQSGIRLLDLLPEAQ